ncbi:MAG TPA: nitrogen fixation protein NifZ [Thiobacillus sp.]|jgi:nitrogen fixation protein NifZ
MIEPREAKYQWGQRMVATADLFNDGTYPDREPEALLVSTGTPGEIVNVGYHEELNLPVYLVEFEAGGVVGCLEEEITPA